ncbi:MAG: response regulator [Verrucomicrobia bacterium]|nr:response regulator [Verrucomicrobiota bacterium]
MPLLAHSGTAFEAPRAATPPPQDRRRGTLMIVDDEEGPRQSLRVVFKSDYDLLIANEGETAVALARQNKVDVAILDIRMVGMSGIELLGRLKDVDPQIEVIMLTAYETIDTIRQALRLGACDYLQKPFDIATVRNAVAAAMERRTLSSEVRTNSEKLRELQDELQKHMMEEEIMRARGEIYASVIHEISSPLTVISALLQSLDHRMSHAARIEGDDLEMVKDRLKRITRQVSLCIEISRRYLSSLRQVPTETPRAWVNQILTDLGELLRVHPASKSSQLVMVPLEEDVSVSINSTDLVQLLLNLVINAFQCTAQMHRVEVRAEVLGHVLRLEDFQNGPQDRFVNRDEFQNKAPLLALSVQDTGPGIAVETLPRIFEPYFTTHKKGQGTGLGLAIVSRFVKQAGGAIHVHSKVGQGTIFTVYLPLKGSAGADLKI